MSGMNYERQRQINEDVSGDLNVAAATGDTTLKTVRNTKTTIFVQKIHIQITTGSAGKTWSIEDSAGSPITLTGNLPVDTAPLSYTIDFGPAGKDLTEATNLVLNVSAAGAVGIVTWEAYQRLTGIGTIQTPGVAGVA